MNLSFVAFSILLWVSRVTALWFSDDFNGTIPNILGLTESSHPGGVEPQSGYADGTSPLHQPWPLSTFGERNANVIRFCYADQASKNALDCNLQRALEMWRVALGGRPSKTTGYNLWFIEEFYKTGTGFSVEAPFCYRDGTYDSKKGRGEWNWRLAQSQDILVVAHRPVDEKGNRPATGATIGYTPDGWLLGKAPAGRHYMQIADKDDVRSIAHELGHVFGLLHEHQRSDRDTYLEYRSANVRGFHQAHTRAMEDGLSDQDARRKLQDDYLYCKLSSFAGLAFIKGAGRESVGGGDFDFDSIMIYPSKAMAVDVEDCRRDVTKCPLARKGKNGELRFYEPGPGPSRGDAEFVRRLYPYVE